MAQSWSSQEEGDHPCPSLARSACYHCHQRGSSDQPSTCEEEEWSEISLFPLSLDLLSWKSVWADPLSSSQLTRESIWPRSLPTRCPRRRCGSSTINEGLIRLHHWCHLAHPLHYQDIRAWQFPFLSPPWRNGIELSVTIDGEPVYGNLTQEQKYHCGSLNLRRKKREQ